MARASNPGAPQRVSAHVVPKASSFSTDDEEEKTTIESGGWEEEASTTVEQGEVADKVRALALGGASPRTNTGITSTTGSGVNDEPTVDDQRASAALAMLPPPSVARLAITQGNDAGQVLEIRPGKVYTVGRGIDNDLVLSDITASRKHFDLRFDSGSWVLADLGSGNGTLINHRIEDAPFLLASGDRIEVGNTAFRFDVVTAAVALPGLPPPGSAQAAPPVEGPPSDLDGDASDSREMATPEVAAAPPGPREPAMGVADPRDSDVANGIPREVPSPNLTYEGSADDDLEMSTVSGKPMPGEPPRPAAPASRPKTLPPPALPPPRPRTQTGRPAMAFAAPRSQQMAVPQAPGIPPAALAAAMAPTISPMHAAPVLPQPATTLPLPQMANRGPLSPALLEPQLAPLPTTLPGQGPPLPPRGPRLPFSYPTAQIAAQRVSGPMRAVGPGMPGRDASTTALVHPMSYGGAPMVPAPVRRRVPPLTRRMKLAAAGVGLVVFAAIATIAIIRSTSDDAVIPPLAPPVVASGATVAAPPVVTPLPPAPSAPTRTTEPAAPRVSAAPVAAPRPAPPPVVTPPAVAAAAPPPPATASSERVSPSPSPPRSPPVVVTPPAVAAAAPPPPATAPSERVAPRSEPPRPSRPAKHVELRRPERRLIDVAAAPPPKPKHAGRGVADVAAVRAEATGLYRSKNFNGAAQAISSSLNGFGADDTRDLKTIAGIYSQLGKAYAVGMAPGTRPVDAFQALRSAINYDREVGGAYQSELRERIAAVAPKAANSYMAAKSYEQALQAVHAAEQAGSTSESLQVVRSSLEGTAHDLLSDARKTLSSDPEGARQKARQVLGIVEPKSPLYAQAQKLINGP